MITSKIRVRYGETDQMGYVYYGNYAEFYEVGRVEALRYLGLPYKELEEQGVMLPVLEFSIKYFAPAYYDEILSIKTEIESIKGARMVFTHEMFNEKEEIINKGKVTLVFVSKENGKPIPPPKSMLDAIEDFKSKEIIKE